MSNAAELEGSGVILSLALIPRGDGRIGFDSADWTAVKEKFALLKENHEKAGRWPNWFVPELRIQFMQATQTAISPTYIYSFIKRTSVPSFWDKDTGAYIFSAWLLALPNDYLLPAKENKRSPVVHSLKLKAVPEREAIVRSAFQQFVDSHSDEIQAPLIKAWKELTCYYSIEVVLEALRRMGFNDSAIAVLSQAAAASNV
jgi:hypothetical protein